MSKIGGFKVKKMGMVVKVGFGYHSKEAVKVLASGLLLGTRHWERVAMTIDKKYTIYKSKASGKLFIMKKAGRPRTLVYEVLDA